MKLFNELPVVLPVYTDKRNQNQFKENVKNNCAIGLMSPSDSILPFMVQLPKDSPKPQSWILYFEDGREFADISNNLNLVKAYNFDDFSYGYYKGEKLTFKFEAIEEDMNISGRLYFVLKVGGQEYFSEVFEMCPEIKSNSFADKFVKIVFSDETDIEPLRYRNGFEQVLYLDTFIHTSETEFVEETEADGFDNKNPTFQKMTIKQKIAVLVPDFLKIAIQTIQIHENIEVFENNKRSGIVDRFKVDATSEEFGALSSLEITIETDVLKKTNCNENKLVINEIWL